MKRIKIHSAIKHLIALILKRRLYRKIRYPCDCAMPITLTNKNGGQINLPTLLILCRIQVFNLHPKIQHHIEYEARPSVAVTPMNAVVSSVGLLSERLPTNASFKPT